MCFILLSLFSYLSLACRLQEPFCPPRPPLPTASTLPSTFAESRLELFRQQNFTDVILVSDRVGFSAHRFILAATRDDTLM